ncbi:hypothetical protein BGX31_010575 [Mortierella sp. GBA43]|nr:hypothetical protein BGX31_010575 [Mortierella sp. GBA43]
MRFFTVSAAALALASVVVAQDANCTLILNDYAINTNGKYGKCYTDQVYNSNLVSHGSSPDYKALIREVCDAKTVGCDDSALFSAANKYASTCGASIDAEAAYGNILQLGKNALEVFFAYPIHGAYCAEDPNAKPEPVTPPAVPPKSYCLATQVQSPSSRFVSNLAIYLTSGTIRSSQAPFFIANNLPKEDVCSPCSQTAVQGTIDYLADNLMPKITPFYTPEFVHYWTALVPAYNTLCGTKFNQAWPAGTLNVTVPNVPTGSPSAPATSLPSATGPSTTAPTTGKSGAVSIKPAAGVAAAFLMAVASLL